MTYEWVDRLDASRYESDEAVHVYRCDQYGPNDAGVRLPERIWDRLRWLGSAYEMHLLPLLDGSTDPVFLNPAQVDQLVQELRFVGQVVDDQMVEAQVRAVIALSEQRSDGASKEMIAIEFP